MQNFLAKGFSRCFSWDGNGAGVSLHGVDKYFSKFGLGGFLQTAHSPRWIGVGWSQLAPAQGTGAPGQAGDALIQQRLGWMVQLGSPSAYSPPTAKTPSLGSGYARLAACFSYLELGLCWGERCCSRGCLV